MMAGIIEDRGVSLDRDLPRLSRGIQPRKPGLRVWTYWCSWLGLALAFGLGFGGIYLARWFGPGSALGMLLVLNSALMFLVVFGGTLYLMEVQISEDR